MTEIIKVKDNIITEHSWVNRELHDDEIQVHGFNGNVGDNTSLYDENWNVIPTEPEAPEEPTTDEDGKTEYIPPAPEPKLEQEQEQCTRTDELMSMLYEIDLSSVRAIRAILSGTASEDDHKILDALEKQAINLRKELIDAAEY